MIEQIFFIVAAISLFSIIFYKVIRKKEKGYIFILIIEFIGIVIDLYGFFASTSINVLLKTIMYIFSILLPIVILILEYKNIDIFNRMKLTLANFYLKIGKTKKAKEILITTMHTKCLQKYMRKKAD